MFTYFSQPQQFPCLFYNFRIREYIQQSFHMQSILNRSNLNYFFIIVLLLIATFICIYLFYLIYSYLHTYFLLWYIKRPTNRFFFFQFYFTGNSNLGKCAVYSDGCFVYALLCFAKVTLFFFQIIIFPLIFWDQVQMKI